MLGRITDALLGKAPFKAKRSRDWPIVRADHLAEFPTCAACGGKVSLNVHHLQPFYSHPELELDPSNLITLCESKRFGLHCHLLIGHLGNYRRINPSACSDASLWKRKLSINTKS